ncbi:MAG TPA: hypothetical protein VKG62_03120 [Solirubrobacteraceae bacterium]|nr:hypothetical protein [Solirubrobacteraceae bacterium]
MSIVRLNRRLALPVILLASTLAAAAPARADVGETIILRCTHGESLAGFSQSAYQQALQQLTADAEEYTPCGSLIRQAQSAAAGGGVIPGFGGLSEAPIPATPAEQAAIEAATRTPPPPVHLAGQLVTPGVVHANIASAFRTLPSPLLATLVFLLVGLVLAGGIRGRGRLRGHRSD